MDLEGKQAAVLHCFPNGSSYKPITTPKKTTIKKEANCKNKSTFTVINTFWIYGHQCGWRFIVGAVKESRQSKTIPQLYNTTVRTGPTRIASLTQNPSKTSDCHFVCHVVGANHLQTVIL